MHERNLKLVRLAEAVAAPTATAAAAGSQPAPTTPPVSPGPLAPNASPGPQLPSASPLWSASPQGASKGVVTHLEDPAGHDDEAGHRLDDGADSPLVTSSEDGDTAAAELDIWQKAHQVQ